MRMLIICVQYLSFGSHMSPITVLFIKRLAPAWLAGDAKLSWQRLALALVPIAGSGIFLGLFMLSLSHLKAERMSLEWVPAVRIGLLLFGSGFSAWLALRMVFTRVSWRHSLAFASFLLPLGLIDGIWSAVFFG